jgi:hypothetical protein
MRRPGRANLSGRSHPDFFAAEATPPDNVVAVAAAAAVDIFRKSRLVEQLGSGLSRSHNLHMSFLPWASR